MATKAQAFIVHPAQGGWDTITAPTLLPPDWLQIADNIEYFKPGDHDGFDRRFFECARQICKLSHGVAGKGQDADFGQDAVCSFLKL